MQTCFSGDDVEYLPIACTVYVHHEDMIGAGTVWAFYPHRCHVESQVPVFPGMTVSLSLQLPGAGRVKIEQGLVTWARASEFGLQFMQGPTVMSHERSTL